ncbi:MFS transporter [Roseomonas sp. BN140053]|uniref:MFS transporter n=1 Tax=Roseomonas sp. BN140053 TaxID=3391898 RepID=UPI0039E7EC2F
MSSFAPAASPVASPLVGPSLAGPPGGPAAPEEAPSRDWRTIGLIGTAHFFSHFYMLCLVPLFPAWHAEFGVSFAALGLSLALMSGVTAVLQTPAGFLVDRYGARSFLVGGSLLMMLSIAAMAAAPSYWVILALAALSGVGNSVYHPADYSILAGSVNKARMGRAFAMHTLTGNLGFAVAPPLVAVLALSVGWRGALLAVGLLGLPVVAAILWQSRFLVDQAKPREAKGTAGPMLLSRPMLLFFAFFLLTTMATSGLQAFLIPLLDKQWGVPVQIGSFALTGYMVGMTLGVLIGGWYADRYKQHMAFVFGLTGAGMVLFLLLGLVRLPDLLVPAVALLGGVALGAARTPRDVMVKDAAPPGQIGKVFGFVSSALPLGQALVPVPFGWLLDAGYAFLALPLVVVLLGLSLLCAGAGRSEARSAPGPVAAE